jgi:hypothetical protein
MAKPRQNRSQLSGWQGNCTIHGFGFGPEGKDYKIVKVRANSCLDSHIPSRCSDENSRRKREF